MGRNYKDFSGDKNPNYKTGYSVKDENGKRVGFYNTWQNIKGRCLRKTHPKYHRYGGRGIKVCDDWLDINKFAEWSLSNGWKEGLTIDRIDNDGDYCPENCQWISASENSRKKSTTKLTKNQAEKIRKRLLGGENEHDLAKEYGVCHGTVWFIKNNYTHVEEGACSKKIKERRESRT